MRVRVRGTLTRVKARGSHTKSHQGYPVWLRLLPLACILIIITALGILAVSEMSMLGKSGVVSPVVGGGGAAARIMPGRMRKQHPSQHQLQQLKKPRPTGKEIVFKMEPLLRRNALSVELSAQMIVNRFRSRAVGAMISKEEVSGETSSSYGGVNTTSQFTTTEPAGRVSCPPTYRNLPDCPLVPPSLNGQINVSLWLKHAEESDDNTMQPHFGGSWSPTDCNSRHSVAIIVPYRNREKQLKLLIKFLPPVLQRQQISYRIFIIEQLGNETFNKGILMNAGFLTALDNPAHGVLYNCFIFHDVDLLPEDDRNMYTCPQQPRHLSVAVNELNYRLPYRVLVGGVFAIRTDHFLRVNGYSNLYWGWGGEDDDMGLRVEHVLNSISRPPEWIARYTMIKHEKRRPLSYKVRHKLLRTSWRRYRLDGLNTVQYGLGKISEQPGYTHVTVDVGQPPSTYRIIEEEEEQIAKEAFSPTADSLNKEK
ncbi:beta-1,4-N-acetylgalactosaminyltransferase bre-4-like isoform X2 [Rhodnius prolixus]